MIIDVDILRPAKKKVQDPMTHCTMQQWTFTKQLEWYDGSECNRLIFSAFECDPWTFRFEPSTAACECQTFDCSNVSWNAYQMPGYCNDILPSLLLSSKRGFNTCLQF